MVQVPMHGIGMKGLNYDTPSQALGHEYFNAGINLRPFNGSLQGVRDFFTSVDSDVNGTGAARNIFAMTQWTNTGSGDVDIAYLFNMTPSSGDSLQLQVVRDVNGDHELVSGALSGITALSFDEKFDIDLFPFNDALIINDGVQQPIIVTRGGTNDNPTYTAKYILGWFSKGSDDFTNIPDTVTAGSTYVVNYGTGRGLSGDTTEDWTPSVTTTNRNDTLNLFNEVFQVRNPANRVTCERMTSFNNRLIALNISDNYVDGGNATMAWSTPISNLGNLNNVTFVPATNNSAGDDIITETPGELLEAKQLGNYLMIYKSDSVFAVQDSGDPLYLISQQIFSDDGVFSPGCVVDIGGGRHFVVGNNGIYIHDGGVNKQNISKGRIEDLFFDSVRQRHRTFCFHQQRDKEVWVCLDSSYAPVSGAEGNANEGFGANYAFVYNYELDAWHYRTLPNATLPGNLHFQTRGLTSTNLDGEYRIYAWSAFGVYRMTPPTEHVAGGFASFDRHDLGDSSMTKRIHALYPQTQNNINIAMVTTASLSDPPAFTPASFRQFTPSTGYKMDYRLYGRYFDIIVQMVGSVNPELTGITADITPGGRR